MERNGGREEGLARLAYSPAEVAAACGLSRKAIYRAIENGELRAAKVCRGRRLLITAEELRAWIDDSVAKREPVSLRTRDEVARRRQVRTPLRDTLREMDAI